MKKRHVVILLIANIHCFYSCSNKNSEKPNEKPNVVIIYTDDIGYGDIGAYGAELIPTPNIDKLASQGIRFTDGHCGASTCSPSRYALLTGEMRFRKNVGIQPVNAPLSIQPEQAKGLHQDLENLRKTHLNTYYNK